MKKVKTSEEHNSITLQTEYNSSSDQDKKQDPAYSIYEDNLDESESEDEIELSKLDPREIYFDPEGEFQFEILNSNSVKVYSAFILNFEDYNKHKPQAYNEKIVELWKDALFDRTLYDIHELKTFDHENFIGFSFILNVKNLNQAYSLAEEKYRIIENSVYSKLAQFFNVEEIEENAKISYEHEQASRLTEFKYNGKVFTVKDGTLITTLNDISNIPLKRLRNFKKIALVEEIINKDNTIGDLFMLNITGNAAVAEFNLDSNILREVLERLDESSVVKFITNHPNMILRKYILSDDESCIDFVVKVDGSNTKELIDKILLIVNF